MAALEALELNMPSEVQNQHEELNLIATLLGTKDEEGWTLDDPLASRDFPKGIKPIRDKDDGVVALFPYHDSRRGVQRMLFVQNAPRIVRYLLNELEQRDTRIAELESELGSRSNEFLLYG